MVFPIRQGSRRLLPLDLKFTSDRFGAPSEIVVCKWSFDVAGPDVCEAHLVLLFGKGRFVVRLFGDLMRYADALSPDNVSSLYELSEAGFSSGVSALSRVVTRFAEEYHGALCESVATIADRFVEVIDRVGSINVLGKALENSLPIDEGVVVLPSSKFVDAKRWKSLVGVGGFPMDF